MPPAEARWPHPPPCGTGEGPGTARCWGAAQKEHSLTAPSPTTHRCRRTTGPRCTHTTHKPPKSPLECFVARGFLCTPEVSGKRSGCGGPGPLEAAHSPQQGKAGHSRGLGAGVGALPGPLTGLRGEQAEGAGLGLLGGGGEAAGQGVGSGSALGRPGCHRALWKQGCEGSALMGNAAPICGFAPPSLG